MWSKVIFDGFEESLTKGPRRLTSGETQRLFEQGEQSLIDVLIWGDVGRVRLIRQRVVCRSVVRDRTYTGRLKGGDDCGVSPEQTRGAFVAAQAGGSGGVLMLFNVRTQIISGKITHGLDGLVVGTGDHCQNRNA